MAFFNAVYTLIDLLAYCAKRNAWHLTISIDIAENETSSLFSCWNCWKTSYTWSLRLSIQIVCIKRSVLEDANTWTFGFCVHWCLQWPSCFSDRSHPAQFFNIWLVRLVAMYLLCRMGATVFVQPLDLVKNRMQLSGETVEAGSCFIFEHR